MITEVVLAQRWCAKETVMEITFILKPFCEKIQQAPKWHDNQIIL